MAAEKPTVLLVDDDRDFLRVLAYQMGECDFRVNPATSAQKGLELLGGGGIDVVVSDLNMPGMTGLQLLQEIRRRGLQTPVILVTAQDSMDNAEDAMKLGAFEFFPKPLEKERLRRAILNALAWR